MGSVPRFLSREVKALYVASGGVGPPIPRRACTVTFCCKKGIRLLVSGLEGRTEGLTSGAECHGSVFGIGRVDTSLRTTKGRSAFRMSRQ